LDWNPADTNLKVCCRALPGAQNMCAIFEFFYSSHGKISLEMLSLQYEVFSFASFKTRQLFAEIKELT
jgi:hypothetical protein